MAQRLTITFTVVSSALENTEAAIQRYGERPLCTFKPRLNLRACFHIIKPSV
jgi:hypothetical protein